MYVTLDGSFHKIVQGVLEGQFGQAKGNLQADVIRKAAKFPTIKSKDIDVALSRNEDIDAALLNINKQIEESPAKFWIEQVERQWLRGIAHKIEPPVIEYAGNKFVKPKNGKWNGFEFKSEEPEFFKYGCASKIESWGVISNWNNDNDVREFCNNIENFGKKVGMTIAPLPEQCIIRIRGISWRSSDFDISKALRNCLEQGVQECQSYFKKQPQFFFVIFNGISEQYDIVKGLLEGNKVDSPIKVPSQCIQLNKYLTKNKSDNYIKNLMLKVNSKMGGKNFRLFGGEYSIPTVPFAPQDQKYSQRISQQRGGQETIESMEQSTASSLDEFRRRNNCLPSTIVFYRDGVSLGQFVDMALSIEFVAMKRAFKYFNQLGEPDYNPKVTLITVQKRHHYRPQATEDMEADDGDGCRNLAPGTVIDASGCHPYEFQFLLNSHKTIQGTNRPALYQVLMDQIGFGAEQIIMLSYYMTHTYQRCPRSVSIPAPVYYAHLACTRGRLLEGQNCDGNMIAQDVASSMSWM